MATKSFNSKSSSLLNLLKSMISTVRSFLFAYMYPRFVESVFTESVAKLKRKAYADVRSIIPTKKNGQIRILEIGIGPGYNFEYYPKKCQAIALDRNPYFKKSILQKLQKYPEITLEKFVNESAENMASIPSNSLDVVISSSIHCSVDNSQNVLKEIRRVLVPGGSYHFFEHCLDRPGTTRFKWQIFFNKIGLWQLTFHGCIFTDIEEKFKKFGLFNYKGKRYTLEEKGLGWTYYPCYLIATHYSGCAVKEE